MVEGFTWSCRDCYVSQSRLQQGLYSGSRTRIPPQAVVVVEWFRMRGDFIASAKETGWWQPLSGSPFASVPFGRVSHGHFVGSAMRYRSVA